LVLSASAFSSLSTNNHTLKPLSKIQFVKMSAIYEEPDATNEPVKVLITLHNGMDTMDVAGPLEVFSQAQHNAKDPGKHLDYFHCTITAH
jgi:hypothetical protein